MKKIQKSNKKANSPEKPPPLVRIEKSIEKEFERDQKQSLYLIIRKFLFHPLLFFTFLRIAYLSNSLQPKKVKRHVFSYLPPRMASECLTKEVVEVVRFVYLFKKREAQNGFRSQKTFDKGSSKKGTSSRMEEFDGKSS